MPNSSKSEGKHAKRSSVTHTACQNCREKRAKCDGNTPCRRCESRQLSCQYAPRSWSSKRSLRETAEHFNEKLRQRERILDAVTSPVIGDQILQYLKDHGADETYEKLESLGGSGGSESTDPKDCTSTMSGEFTPTSQKGIKGFDGFQDCSGAANCECLACWPATPAMGNSSNVSLESQRFLSVEPFPTLPNGAHAFPLLECSQDLPILPDGAGLGMYKTTDVPNSTLPVGVVDSSMFSTDYAAMGWPTTLEQGSAESELMAEVFDVDKMENPSFVV